MMVHLPRAAHVLANWSDRGSARFLKSPSGAGKEPTPKSRSRSSPSRWPFTGTRQQCPIPFVHLAATCSESSSSGFWTGGELRTAFSDEVGPCLNAVLLLLGEMFSVARH